MKDKEGKKGFTLVELLVSFFMFVIVIGGMTSSLLKAVKVQQRMVANQKMLTEANFLMDRTVRELKSVQIDHGGSLIGKGLTYYSPMATKISFINSNTGAYQNLYLSSPENVIKLDDGSDTQISSDKVEVTQLTFSSAGSNWDSAEEHPRVAISMTIKSKETGDEITVQTVVSPLKKDVSLPQD